jgi:SAM-dependent methyltransferase
MFYQSISQVYDYIFPQNEKQVNFINELSKIKTEDKILDIGCATGNLTDLLCRYSKNVIGLDLDQGLLKQANEKYTHSFVYGNMLHLKELFVNKFDKIVSFGNTLVHLPNRELVKSFFRSVFEQLVDEGDFICQIINYDRIYDEHIEFLPTIDNNYINFQRLYKLHSDHVDFDTKLTIKSNGQIIENSIPLLNLKKEEIKLYLEQTGFSNIRFYGGLNGKTLTNTDIPLIFSCRK